jgi:hypothetical protein
MSNAVEIQGYDSVSAAEWLGVASCDQVGHRCSHHVSRALDHTMLICRLQWWLFATHRQVFYVTTHI